MHGVCGANWLNGALLLLPGACPGGRATAEARQRFIRTIKPRLPLTLHARQSIGRGSADSPPGFAIRRAPPCSFVSIRCLQPRHMKRCNDCQTFAAEDSTFCRTCGSSFSLKLCPKGHVNPPSAHFCATCGSGDLSRPHHLRPSRYTTVMLSAAGLAALVALGLAAILAIRLWP